MSTCCASPETTVVVTPRGTPFASQYIVRWKCKNCGRFVKELPPQIAEEEPMSEEEALKERTHALYAKIKEIGGIVTQEILPYANELDISLRLGNGNLHFYRSARHGQPELSEEEIQVLESILELTNPKKDRPINIVPTS